MTILYIPLYLFTRRQRNYGTACNMGWKFFETHIASSGKGSKEKVLYVLSSAFLGRTREIFSVYRVLYNSSCSIIEYLS